MYSFKECDFNPNPSSNLVVLRLKLCDFLLDVSTFFTKLLFSAPFLLRTRCSAVKILICAERLRPASGKCKHSVARQENNEKTVTPVYSSAVKDNFLCYQSGGISIKAC